MNSTSLFLDPVQTVHFLSLFSYMNRLSDIFYHEDLIKEEDKQQTFRVVNAFYEYLERAKNETEAKQQLVQKLLEGSELYGGNKNETLDMGYVNNTLDYIITNAVFAQSGNLYGYLAEIVTVSGLKLSVFKKKILEHLSYLRHINDEGDVLELTKLARIRIAETLLWPLFPDPPTDVELISAQYIYALAGFNFAKSAQMNLTEIPFRKYVTLAMAIEASVMAEQLPNSALQIFALPALLYYGYNETKLHQETWRNLMKNEDFWSEAYLNLFSYLKGTFEMIRQETLEANSIYRFHLAMSGFKNRTAVAWDVIRKECKFNESYTESLIEDYKTYSVSTGCYKGGKKLPNLELVYDAQFHSIKEKYRLMEIDFIRAAFDDFPIVRNLINEPNTTVLRSHPKQNEMYCPLCPPLTPSYHPSITFFAIDNGQQAFYALQQNENNITLLIEKDNSEFNKLVGLPKGHKLEISKMRKYKIAGENFDAFVERFAEIKAEEFRHNLFEYGYDKTNMEKFFEIITAFIPFYHCIKYANSGQQGPAALSCIGDIVGLVPLAGVFNIGFKMSSVATGRFLLASGLTLKTFTLRQAILTTMITGLRETAMGFNVMVTKLVLTKQMLKSVSIAIVRSLDPGIELIGKLASHGSALICRVLKKAFRNISKKFPSLNFKYAKYESIWAHQKLISSDLEILPEIEIEGHEVFRLIYPGGNHPFGPKYIRLSKGYAELRRMVGFDKEIPVIARATKRRILYLKVNLQTEEPFGLEMKLNKEGLLENVRLPFREHIYKIKTEGFGGRGALMDRREESIRNAGILLTRARFYTKLGKPVDRIRNYVLAIDSPTPDIMELDAELINFKNLEVNVKEFVKKHLTEIDGSVMVDPALNKYLPTPTYRNFAIDWIETRMIDETYKDFYVSKPHELENLLYKTNMEEITEYNVADVERRIITHYGWYDQQMNIKDIFNKFIIDDAWRDVRFEDYYAFFAFLYNDYSKVISNPKFLRKALYKLAIRQSFDKFADNKVSRVLHFLDKNNPNFYGKSPSDLVGQSIKSSKIFTSTNDKRYLYEKLRFWSSPKSTDIKNIVWCEVHIDSPYLVVNLNDIFPLEDASIILPDTVFRVAFAERQLFEGFNILKIILRNEPIAKEILIARLMKKMDDL